MPNRKTIWYLPRADLVRDRTLVTVVIKEVRHDF